VHHFITEQQTLAVGGRLSSLSLRSLRDAAMTLGI
jgi:hypothetical protein